MNILTISGSSRKESSNRLLLDNLSYLRPDLHFIPCTTINELPLFHPHLVNEVIPAVSSWKAQLADADAVIICTPEYLHNLPALIKNGLEWLAASGELVEKNVLALTYTPAIPRGEKAMKSLLWSLQALDARVLTSMCMDKNSLQITQGKIVGEDALVLKEALRLLSQAE